MSADNGFGTSGHLYAVGDGVAPSEPKRDEATWQAWLSSKPQPAPQPVEPPPPTSGRDWREMWSNVAELGGIGAISAGFCWFSPGLGLISGGLGLVVVGLLSGLPRRAGD